MQHAILQISPGEYYLDRLNAILQSPSLRNSKSHGSRYWEIKINWGLQEKGRKLNLQGNGENISTHSSGTLLFEP